MGKETRDAKKAAFFKDWKGVNLDNAIGFQEGWEKGWNAAIAHAKQDTLRDAAKALVEELESWPRAPFENYKLKLDQLKAALELEAK